MVKQFIVFTKYKYKIRFDCMASVRSLLHAQFHILSIKRKTKSHNPVNKINYSGTFEMQKARKNAAVLGLRMLRKYCIVIAHYYFDDLILFIFEDVQDSIFSGR